MCFASAPKAPEKAEFYPIDIPGTANQAREADIAAYGRSDADFAARFPGLVKGEKTSLDQANKNLTGPLDPTAQSSFVTKGLEKSMGAFGSGNPLAGVTEKGSAARNTTAASFANSVLEKQDYDRDVFSNALATNLPRAIGPSGEDAVSWMIKNTGDQNQINRGNYIGSVQQKNAEDAASAQNTQAAVQTAIAIAGIAAMFLSDRKTKKDIKTVGKSPYLGIPIKEFSYKGSKDRYVGAIAQDVEKVAPEAVGKDDKGRKGVRYGMIDVPFYQVKPSFVNA